VRRRRRQEAKRIVLDRVALRGGLADAEQVGLEAARRTVAKLGARKIPTGRGARHLFAGRGARAARPARRA
jgi:predicted Zn-dependent protease